VTRCPGFQKRPSFDVQVQKIAGIGVFVAQHGWRWLQLCQPMQTEPSQATRYRADGQTQVVSNLSIGLACPALLDKAIE